MQGPEPGRSGSLLVATSLIAAGMLTAEVALTRVLSVMYYSNYVFLVLSTALLGLGLGAALGTWRAALRRYERLSTYAAAAALAVTLLGVITAHWGHPVPVFVAATLPFIFAGLALSSIFSLRPAASFRLYWADLLGAGLGSFASVVLLDLLGGSGALLAGALLLASASLALRGGGTVAALSAAALVLNLATAWFEPNMANLPTAKPLADALAAGGHITESRWTAFARSDMVYRPDQDSYYLYIDGAAGSFVPNLQHPERWLPDIGLVPFANDEPQSAFLLGPGGGLDVALARAEGVGTITAVELNGAAIQMVAELAPQLGDVYGGVEVHVDEGRSVLRRKGELYDLIFLSHVITQTSDSRGYALSEATVYTVEAFGDYLNHLTPNGQLAIKLYDELTLTRALVTAVEALKRRGATDAEAAHHLFAALDTSTTPPLPLLLVRNAPLTESEATRLARTSEQLGMALLFVPGLLAAPPMDGLLAGTTTAANLVASAAATGVDTSAVTDARPYFFQFEVGLPATLKWVAVLLIALVLVGLMWFAATLPRRRAGTWRAAPLAAAALGAGFMALELTVLQRTQLYLGHPTLALALVLGTLLLGGGVGSLLANRWLKASTPRTVALSSLLVVLLAVLWHLGWPLLASMAQAQPLALRFALLAGSLAPLALSVGVPFPALLGQLREAPGKVAGAWALNGVGAVVGSVGAVLLALLHGNLAVLGLAAVGYLVTCVAAWTGRRATPLGTEG